MTVVAPVLAGVFGLAVGSLLNVVVHRVPRGASIVRPASACPSCGAAIRPRDNVPVVSYLLLGGKCRSCGVRISVRYPAVELLTAALFAAAWIRLPRPDDATFACAAIAVLLALAFIDLEHRRVPNVISLPATGVLAAWAVVMGLLSDRMDQVTTSLLCGAAGFAVLFVLALISGGIGFGDVKLAALIGVATGWFGWETWVLALAAGFGLGGLVGAVLLVSRRRGRRDAIPFAPMLCGGAVLALFLGQAPVRAWLGLP